LLLTYQSGGGALTTPPIAATATTKTKVKNMIYEISALHSS